MKINVESGELIGDHFKVHPFTHRLGRGEGIYEVLHIRAGQSKTTHVVPPAGEQYAHEHTEWSHTIEISVSPTGRSVIVYVDGQMFTKDSNASATLPQTKHV